MTTTYSCTGFGLTIELFVREIQSKKLFEVCKNQFFAFENLLIHPRCAKIWTLLREQSVMVGSCSSLLTLLSREHKC